MREFYRAPKLVKPEKKLGLSSKFMLKAMGGAAVLALLPAAIAGAHSKEQSGSPVARVADRLERKIKNDPQAKVGYDATQDLYWGETNKGIFRFRTDVPLIARVGAQHVLRYFGIRNEGDARRDIDVFPIPVDGVMKAQSIHDGYYHDGTDSSSRGTLQLDPDTHKITTVLTYANGDPSERVNVGDTSRYGSGVIIGPPPVPPGPLEGPPLPPGY